MYLRRFGFAPGFLANGEKVRRVYDIQKATDRFYRPFGWKMEIINYYNDLPTTGSLFDYRESMLEILNRQKFDAIGVHSMGGYILQSLAEELAGFDKQVVFIEPLTNPSLPTIIHMALCRGRIPMSTRAEWDLLPNNEFSKLVSGKRIGTRRPVQIRGKTALKGFLAPAFGRIDNSILLDYPGLDHMQVTSDRFAIAEMLAFCDP